MQQKYNVTVKEQHIDGKNHVAKFMSYVLVGCEWVIPTTSVSTRGWYLSGMHVMCEDFVGGSHQSARAKTRSLYRLRSRNAHD